jgi:hypothetical protein
MLHHGEGRGGGRIRVFMLLCTCKDDVKLKMLCIPSHKTKFLEKEVKNDRINRRKTTVQQMRLY